MSNQNTEKLVLEIEEKEQFNGIAKIDYKSSTSLSMSINSIFQSVFKDYAGCYIEVGNPANNEPAVSVVMDFIPGTDNNKGGEIAAFTNIGNKDKTQKKMGPIAASIMQHNQIIETKETYEITQDAVDILYELLIPSIKQKMKSVPKAFQSHGIYTEGVVPSNGFMNQNIIHEYVRWIDIEGLLKAMLPEKNTEGNKVMYTIAPVNSMPTPMNIAVGTSNYLFAITQYDLVAMQNMVREYGRTNPTIQNRVVSIV